MNSNFKDEKGNMNLFLIYINMLSMNNSASNNPLIINSICTNKNHVAECGTIMIKSKTEMGWKISYMIK